MVEEELQAAKRRLAAAARERDEMCGPEKPVSVDSAKDFKVARRENHATHRGALEARPADLYLGHPVSVPGGERSG
jgi:hypothetical protein